MYNRNTLMIAGAIATLALAVSAPAQALTLSQFQNAMGGYSSAHTGDPSIFTKSTTNTSTTITPSTWNQGPISECPGSHIHGQFFQEAGLCVQIAAGEDFSHGNNTAVTNTSCATNTVQVGFDVHNLASPFTITNKGTTSTSGACN